MSPDGQRFVFLKPPDAPAGDAADAEPADPVPPRFNVVVNFFEELKARVPVN